LIVSDDHGATWSSFATLPPALASDTVTALLDRPGWLCAAGNLSVACSADAGATWTTVHTVHSPTARVEAIALWPDDAPERLLVSDTLGLYRYDGAETQLRDTTTPTWPLLATADDGTVFGVDVTGQLYTSADGGDTFVASAVTLPTQTRAMVPRPDFAAHPDLFLGTLDGTFVVRGDTVERYANLQRVDDGAQFVLCEACTSVDDAAAVLGQHSELAVNSWIEGNLRGTRLALIGAAPAGAVVRVTVDEVEQGSFTVDPSEDITGELWSADGWTDGWHRVRVRVDVGTVDVDALEARGPSAELDHDATGDTGDTAADTASDTGVDTGGDTGTDTDDTASDSGSDTSGDPSQDTAADTGRPKPDVDCGCGTTGRGAGWAAVLLGLLGLRRRRAG